MTMRRCHRPEKHPTHKWLSDRQMVACSGDVDPRTALDSVTLYFIGATEDEALAGDAYYTAMDANAVAQALAVRGQPMPIYTVPAYFSRDALRLYELDACDECGASLPRHWKGCSES